jgi:hypothetical protein
MPEPVTIALIVSYGFHIYHFINGFFHNNQVIHYMSDAKQANIHQNIKYEYDSDNVDNDLERLTVDIKDFSNFTKMSV